MASRRRLVLTLLVLAVLAGAGVAAGLALDNSSPGPAHKNGAAGPTQTRSRTRSVPATSAPSGPRIVSGPHDARVPILMYHVLGTPSASAPNPGLFVSRGDFEGQMRWLAANGYHGVTLRRVYDYWTKGYALPPKPVVVSFDDGYLADYTIAMPVLQRHGWPGVLNLEVNNARPGNLAPGQVAALVRAGWELDAHTITHPDLRAVGDIQLREETAGARTWIRRRFRVPVEFFCYPAGMYDARVVAAVRAAGYLGATTVNFGLAAPSDGMFTLNRVRINGSDGVAGFASKLSGLA
ncbi:MAG: polysaccharide deacetylase family protein [Actinomycetota bacterium]|nr:polysaccharide deacetylase family protein [Actinomycetota bacterium]